MYRGDMTSKRLSRSVWLIRSAVSRLILAFTLLTFCEESGAVRKNYGRILVLKLKAFQGAQAIYSKEDIMAPTIGAWNDAASLDGFQAEDSQAVLLFAYGAYVSSGDSKKAPKWRVLSNGGGQRRTLPRE